ncbi:MAG: hypothetical protein V4596_07845 [Bdellovibrionota bacterium]
MKFLNALTFAVCFLNLTMNVACTGLPLERSPNSGYTSYSDSDFREVSLRDISGRHNDFSSRSLSPRESTEYQTTSEKKNLESNLLTPEERKQYLRYKPYLNEEEKIEFLQLADVFARERWIQARGLGFSAERYNRTIASLIEQNDIALGMQKDAVRESWGDPDFVEVSGNPQFENERWTFSLPVQTQEDYKIEKRLVYFENGRVVGWSTR